MAFDPSSAALLEAPEFDPASAELAEDEKPAFDPVSAEPYEPAEIQQAEEQQEIERNFRAPKALNNAAEAAVETLSGFIPRSVGDVAHLVTPVPGALDDIKRGYNIAKDITEGKSAEEAVKAHAPETTAFVEAAKTEPLSKERFKVGFDTVAQMLMAKAIAGSVKPKAAEVPKVEAVDAVVDPRTLQEASPPIAQDTPQLGLREDKPSTQPKPSTSAAQREAEYQAMSQKLDELNKDQFLPEPQRESVEAPRPMESTPTSTKNAVTEAERIARDIEPAAESARREFGTVWDEVDAVVKADSGAPQRLVDSIIENRGRALNDHENAMLLRKQIEVQNAHDAAIKAVNEAKDPTSLADAQARLAEVRDELQQVYDADKLAGTETARGLNARKMLANADYSLARMESTTRAIINDGKPLSAKQAAEVKAVHERLKDVETKLKEYETRERFAQFIRDSQREAKLRRSTGKTHEQFLKERADAARERAAKAGPCLI